MSETKTLLERLEDLEGRTHIEEDYETIRQARYLITRMIEAMKDE